MKSKFQKEEVMKVIRKGRNVCLFEDLDLGDVFRLSETGSLFMKIDNPDNKILSSLNIETGRLYEMYSKDEVISVDGYFVEGIDENDS